MLVQHLLQDLRFAWRGLMGAKGFTAAAVLTMAVGVGGTSAMFALVQGVLLRPLPVPDQDRVIVAWKALPSAGVAHWPLGRLELEAITDASRTLAVVGGVSYYRASRQVVTEREATSSISTALVTGAFFDVLGVRPVLGGTLTPRDDVDGAEPVLVITHGLWQRRYGGARDVIGRRIGLDDRSFTIVGVIGLAVAAALGRLVSGMLYGVHPLDPETLLLSTVLLLALAALAAYVPARRAARLDPVALLRAD